jgi:hypothetical protein
VAPLAIFAWYTSGPGKHGWAARSGTPVTILARRVAATQILTSAVAPPTSFASTVKGRISETTAGSGRVTIRLDLRILGGPGGAARIDLQGIPSGGGVSLTASGASFVPATTGAVYAGSVVGLEGSRIVARVSDAAGQRLDLAFNLAIDTSSGRVGGTVSAATAGNGE